MPSLTTIMGIILAITIAWGSAATWYAKVLIEDKAKVEMALNQANSNTEEQKKINVDLRSQVAAEQKAIGLLDNERTKDNVRYQKDLARMAEQQIRANALAIKYPARYGRAVTNDLRRVMRSVCRSGGGDKNTCRIKGVFATKAKSRNPVSVTGKDAKSMGKGKPKPSSDMSNSRAGVRP